MADSIRDTPAGEFLRFVGFKSSLCYPEERADYQPPCIPVLADDIPSSDEKDLEKSIPKTSATTAASEEEKARPLSGKDLSSEIVVSWTENDKNNPRNWSSRKKTWTVAIINLYTFVVYCTASIITPTGDFIVRKFNVSIIVASLGLSMYVVGCRC